MNTDDFVFIYFLTYVIILSILTIHKRFLKMFQKLENSNNDLDYLWSSAFWPTVVMNAETPQTQGRCMQSKNKSKQVPRT